MSKEVFVIAAYSISLFIFLGILVWKRRGGVARVEAGGGFLKIAEIGSALILAAFAIYFRYEKGEIFSVLSHIEAFSGSMVMAVIVFAGIPGGALISYFVVSGEKYSAVFRALCIGLLTIVPFFLYYIFVFPGLIEPAFKELPAAYFDSRFNPNYFPSAIEWLSTLGILAGCFLIWDWFNKLLEKIWTGEN